MGSGGRAAASGGSDSQASGTGGTTVDPCLNNGGCSANAFCTNTVGIRYCDCKPGFTGDGLTCTDVNECANANAGCGFYANCTNTPGSWSCSCKEGYAGDGTFSANGLICTPIPPPQPISTWRFERQTIPTLVLDNWGTNNGTVVSGTALPPVAAIAPVFTLDRHGVADGALRLENSVPSNWVYIPTSDSIDLPWARSAISVTMWVRVNGVSTLGTSYLFDRGSSTDSWGVSISVTNGRARATIGSLVVESPNPMLVGPWTFLCVTYDGLTLHLYENSGLVGSTPTMIAYSTSGTANIAIGASIAANRASSYGFISADIDEVRLYRYALPAPQVEMIHGE